MPQLEIKLAGKVLNKITLSKDRTRIGRNPDNDIVLKNPAVSKSHAVIEQTTVGTMIRDLGSINGTFVNEMPVTEEKLKDGDLITIAKYELIYLEDVKKTAPDTGEPVQDIESTMILDTRKQREMLQKAKEAQKITSQALGSVLVGIKNTDVTEFPFSDKVVTFGKDASCDIHVPGLFMSAFQATISKDRDDYYLTSIGKAGKTKLDGVVVTKERLRHNSMIEVGKSLFRFLKG